MKLYLLDTIRVTTFAGMVPQISKSWVATYDDAEAAEAAFTALADRYDVLAAALYQWEGQERERGAMHNQSWAARSASMGIRLTVIAHGDRAYIDDYITASQNRCRNTYITLNDWTVVRPQGMTSAAGDGFKLGLRETPQDIADLIRRGVTDATRAGAMTAHFDYGPTVPAGHRQPRTSRAVTAEEAEAIRQTERNVVIETVRYTPEQLAVMPLIRDYLDHWRHRIPVHPEGFYA